MSLRKHEEEEILSKQREWEKVCLFLQPLHLTHFELLVWGILTICKSKPKDAGSHESPKKMSWMMKSISPQILLMHTQLLARICFGGFRVCFSVCTLNMNWQPKVMSYLKKSSRIKDRDQNKPKDKRLLAKKETRWRNIFKKIITNILRDTT